MPLSGHVYWVAVSFRMTEQVEQCICIKVWVKLGHSSMETIWMIQKATAMGNWRLAASSPQYTHSCITSCSEIFGKISNHPSESALLYPKFGSLGLLALPKAKITFEREEISDHQWDPEKYDGTADGDWENCVRSQRTYFEGDWGTFVISTMFLVSSSMSLFFIVHGQIFPGQTSYSH